MTIRRNIVKIDEEKCDGCGVCVPACAEGALQVIDGKARLVSETYCDGLGACLGECPQGAITVEEREAEEFDLEAVHHHVAADCALVGQGLVEDSPRRVPSQREPTRGSPTLPLENEGRTADKGCPGAASRLLTREQETKVAESERSAVPASVLGNWPVQLRLVPVRAPYFDGSTLLITADCVPFAFSDFHRRFLSEKTLLIGCPKLDDTELYHRKLAQIFLQNDIREVEVVYMEVPCCYGLVHLVQQALKESGRDIPLALTKISIKGEIIESTKLQDDMEEGRRSG
jgi:NAD-dependent dihydropyrimidine dehydrogenase PreA subunit